MINSVIQTLGTSFEKNRLRYGEQIDTIARLLVCVGLFCLPLSATLKALIVIAAVLALFGNQVRQNFHWVWTYKMNYFAIALLVWFIIAAYFNGNSGAELHYLFKHGRNFLLPFLLVPLFVEASWRRAVLNALIITAVVITIGEYLEIFGVIDFETRLGRTLDSYLLVPWSIYVAFTVFVLANRILDESRNRIWNIGIFVYLLFFLFFTNVERTGMLIAASLFFLMLIQRLSWRGRLFGVLSVPILLGAFYFSSPVMQQRANEAISDAQNYMQGYKLSSVGLRLHFIKESLSLIEQKPWFGYGTASYRNVLKTKYSDLKQNIQAPDYILTDPHSIYLHITLKAGVISLILLLGWIITQIFDAMKLPVLERRLAIGLILTLIISGNFENSLAHTRMFTWYVALLSVLFAAKITKKPL